MRELTQDERNAVQKMTDEIARTWSRNIFSTSQDVTPSAEEVAFERIRNLVVKEQARIDAKSYARKRNSEMNRADSRKNSYSSKPNF
jgi:hypothetical protein